MRHGAKLILFAALSATLTVAGISVASSGTDSSTSGREQGRHPKQRGIGPPSEVAFDQDVADVMRQVHQAIEKKAPEIAGPIIQKAQDSGDITSDQAGQLRAAAQAIADGRRPDADVRALLGDADVRQVVRDAFREAAKQAPAIGDPIIQKALDEKKITNAQAENIRKKLKNLSSLRGGPPPFGTPGVPHGGLDSHRWDGPDRHGQPRGNAPGAYPNGPAPGAPPAKLLPTI